MLTSAAQSEEKPQLKEIRHRREAAVRQRQPARRPTGAQLAAPVREGGAELQPAAVVQVEAAV